MTQNIKIYKINEDIKKKYIKDRGISFTYRYICLKCKYFFKSIDEIIKHLFKKENIKLENETKKEYECNC